MKLFRDRRSSACRELNCQHTTTVEMLFSLKKNCIAGFELIGYGFVYANIADDGFCKRPQTFLQSKRNFCYCMRAGQVQHEAGPLQIIRLRSDQVSIAKATKNWFAGCNIFRIYNWIRTDFYSIFVKTELRVNGKCIHFLFLTRHVSDSIPDWFETRSA